MKDLSEPYIYEGGSESVKNDHKCITNSIRLRLMYASGQQRSAIARGYNLSLAPSPCSPPPPSPPRLGPGPVVVPSASAAVSYCPPWGRARERCSWRCGVAVTTLGEGAVTEPAPNCWPVKRVGRRTEPFLQRRCKQRGGSFAIQKGDVCTDIR